VAALLTGLLFMVLVTVIIGLPYGLIRASSDWPRWAHWAVVVLSVLLLGMGLRIIMTRELRRKWFPWIFEMFGPLGPLVYGAMILVTASAAFASVTFILVDAGAVEMSSDLPGGVTEGRLVDFYIWHFFELVPLVSINETANLAEPATYSGTWVGLLVLTFQALVVIPILATVSYFFTDEGREARQRYREKRKAMQ
jgi:hypothetical protein